MTIVTLEEAQAKLSELIEHLGRRGTADYPKPTSDCEVDCRGKAEAEAPQGRECQRGC